MNKMFMFCNRSSLSDAPRLDREIQRCLEIHGSRGQAAGRRCSERVRAVTVFLMVNLPSVASTTSISLVKQEAEAKNNHPSLTQELNALTLMTAHDLSKHAGSNLYLTNNTNDAITVYGFYIHGIAWVNAGQSCQDGVMQGENTYQNFNMVGGTATPIPFTVGQSISVGQNYLYNMFYNYLYWTYLTQGGNLQIGCVLPGCSWPGDQNPPLNWCLQVGAISPDSSYTFSQYPPNIIPLHC